MSEGTERPPEAVSTPTTVSTGKTKTLGLDYSIAAVLTYLPIFPINLIFSIIWLKTEPKENRALRFHATQSLVMSVVGIVASFASMTAGLIPIIGGLVGFCMGIFGLAMFVCSLIALIQAYQGKIFRIPVVADIADKYNPA